MQMEKSFPLQSAGNVNRSARAVDVWRAGVLKAEVIVDTKVFCTQEELKAIKEKASAAQLAQMTAARFGPTRADDLWSELRKEIHALALAKGLPEVEGFYGMDNDGQFIKAG